MTYIVAARPYTLGDLRAFGVRRGRGRHSFRVVLKPRRRARRVQVLAVTRDYPQHQRIVVVPVSG